MHPQSTANSCQKKERHSKNHRQLSLSTLTQVETAHQEGLRFLAKFPCCEFEWQGSSRFADFTLRFLCFGIIHEHWLLLWQRNFNVWPNKKGKRKKKNPPHCWQCFCLPACWNCVFFLWVLTPHSQTLCSFLLLLLLLNQSALLSHSTECGWWSQSGCYHSRSTDNGTDAAPFVHNKFTCAAENCYRFSVPGRKDRKLLGRSDKPIFIMESTVTPSEWMWNKYLLP